MKGSKQLIDCALQTEVVFLIEKKKKGKQTSNKGIKQPKPSTSKKATPAQISSYRLGDFIHEVFDKENASEKDADFD